MQWKYLGVCLHDLRTGQGIGLAVLWDNSDGDYSQTAPDQTARDRMKLRPLSVLRVGCAERKMAKDTAGLKCAPDTEPALNTMTISMDPMEIAAPTLPVRTWAGRTFFRDQSVRCPRSMLAKLANRREKEVNTFSLPYGLCLPSFSWLPE